MSICGSPRGWIKAVEQILSTPVVEAEREVEQALSPLYRVIIHNDDVTPMDFVIAVLRSEFELETPRAFEVMMEAHETGAAHVLTCPREEATLKVERSHSLARARGFPLTFSIEPEDP